MLLVVLVVDVMQQPAEMLEHIENDCSPAIGDSILNNSLMGYLICDVHC